MNLFEALAFLISMFGGLTLLLGFVALVRYYITDKGAGPWRTIKTFRGPDRQDVDLWLEIYASPRSFGMSESFRVVEAYRLDGKWVHRHEGKEKELYADYITHWMPIPKAPRKGPPHLSIHPSPEVTE